MNGIDVRRTDDHHVAFLSGWADAFPENIWIAGVDLRNHPRPREYRLKAAMPTWSGPEGKTSSCIAASFDLHIECVVDDAGQPKGALKVHLETNPYALEKKSGCTSGQWDPGCEACQRRHAAKHLLAQSGAIDFGTWQIAPSRNKLTLAKLPKRLLSQQTSTEQVSAFLKSVMGASEKWANAAIQGWTMWRS